MDNATKQLEPQPQNLTDASDLRYLEPTSLQFFRHGAALRLTVSGELSCLQVTVLRLFPLSEPQSYLSIRSGDNKEIGVLRTIAELDTESRQLVVEELERRYLVPVVQRVLAVKERFGTVEWKVETDRGVRTFTTRELRENLVTPTPNRYILNDVDGNRFDIRDLSVLDAASRRHFSKYI